MNFIFIYLKINVTPYNIPDQGLGQDPNVVLGLAEQYGLLPGTKLSADNLFNSDHMSEKELGLVGTLRHNQVVGVPLPSRRKPPRTWPGGHGDHLQQQHLLHCVERLPACRHCF